MTNAPWWSQAVFYQIYPRSFADGNGDGTGDLAGISSRLDYLVELGVDAIWISPFQRSPQVDHGYDISDHCDVDPLFGTLADFDSMLAGAHERGLRVTIDMVPNHSSDQHPWFQRALASGPGSPERELYVFRDGLGEHGELPPTNVASLFGGPAWTRVTEPDGQPGQWYFHLFAAQQPDWNWGNEAVLEEFRRVFRFWLDRGVDGFRIDAGDALIKHPAYRGDDPLMPLIRKDPNSPVHRIYRELRKVMDSYPGERMAVLEMGGDREVLTSLVRPDEMHLYFNFPFMHSREWDDDKTLAEAIDLALWMRGSTGTPPTWVTDNHDTPRSVTRYGSHVQLAGDYVPTTGDPAPPTTDLTLGTRRARAMALALLSLPGAAYIYNGQELGLPNVDDLPEELLQDPVWERTGHQERGRDGCRIPLPWGGAEPPYEFSPTGTSTWLPQPTDWAPRSVAAQRGDPDSMLARYRHLLALRRAHPALRTGAVTWLPRPPHTIGYERTCFAGEHPGAAVIEVWLNLGTTPIALPSGEILASSAPVTDTLPADTAAWVRTR
ncbi:MAG: glycoside hydrolase family 13 protein [Candidatus Nanopelagicales bacterium]